jgi:hypothetical protein
LFFGPLSAGSSAAWCWCAAIIHNLTHVHEYAEAFAHFADVGLVVCCLSLAACRFQPLDAIKSNKEAGFVLGPGPGIDSMAGDRRWRSQFSALHLTHQHQWHQRQCGRAESGSGSGSAQCTRGTYRYSIYRYRRRYRQYGSMRYLVSRISFLYAGGALALEVVNTYHITDNRYR